MASHAPIILVPGLGGSILRARFGPPDNKQEVVVWPSLRKTESMMRLLWCRTQASSSQIVNIDNVEIFVSHAQFGLESLDDLFLNDKIVPVQIGLPKVLCNITEFVSHLPYRGLLSPNYRISHQEWLYTRKRPVCVMIAALSLSEGHAVGAFPSTGAANAQTQPSLRHLSIA